MGIKFLPKRSKGRTHLASDADSINNSTIATKQTHIHAGLTIVEQKQFQNFVSESKAPQSLSPLGLTLNTNNPSKSSPSVEKKKIKSGKAKSSSANNKKNKSSSSTSSPSVTLSSSSNNDSTASSKRTNKFRMGTRPPKSNNCAPLFNIDSLDDITEFSQETDDTHPNSQEDAGSHVGKTIDEQEEYNDDIHEDEEELVEVISKKQAKDHQLRDAMKREITKHRSGEKKSSGSKKSFSSSRGSSRRSVPPSQLTSSKFDDETSCPSVSEDEYSVSVDDESGDEEETRFDSEEEDDDESRYYHDEEEDDETKYYDDETIQSEHEARYTARRASSAKGNRRRRNGSKSRRSRNEAKRDDDDTSCGTEFTDVKKLEDDNDGVSDSEENETSWFSWFGRGGGDDNATSLVSGSVATGTVVSGSAGGDATSVQHSESRMGGDGDATSIGSRVTREDLEDSQEDEDNAEDIELAVVASERKAVTKKQVNNSNNTVAAVIQEVAKDKGSPGIQRSCSRGSPKSASAGGSGSTSKKKPLIIISPHDSPKASTTAVGSSRGSGIPSKKKPLIIISPQDSSKVAAAVGGCVITSSKKPIIIQPLNRRKSKSAPKDPQECSSDMSVMNNVAMMDSILHKSQIKTCPNSAALNNNEKGSTTVTGRIASPIAVVATAIANKKNSISASIRGAATPATSAMDTTTDLEIELDTDVRQRDIYCTNHGGVDTLTLRQYPSIVMPERPDHVLVKVEASTVSASDCITRMKGDPQYQPNPCVPGNQVVGEIIFLGEDVRAEGVLKKGDRIAALTKGFGNAKYISIAANMAIVIPQSASSENVVCLVENYMTAYQTLKLAKKGGAPLTNANVLITGGSGPVGQALVDLASREGAKVYTTSHKMHEEHMVQLGAKCYPIKPKKWLPILEGKMDVVVDSICVDGYDSSYRALTPDGILVCTGNMSSTNTNLGTADSLCHAIDPSSMKFWWSTMKAKYIWNRSIFYDIRESFENDPKMFKQELLYLICKLEANEISPKVAGRVSLNQVPKAQRLIEKGLPNGTVICFPWKKLCPKQKVPLEKFSR